LSAEKYLILHRVIGETIGITVQSQAAAQLSLPLSLIAGNHPASIGVPRGSRDKTKQLNQQHD